MDDNARLERALIAADAAGDTEAATALAQELRRRQRAAQPAPAAPEPSWLERRGADLKANARAAAEGIGGAIGIVTDPFAQALQGVSNMVTGNNTRAMTMSETFGAGAEAAGLPALDPNSAATPIMRGVYGALPTLGIGAAAQSGARLAPTVTQRVGEVLAARPTMQLVSAGTAAGAADLAGDAGAGPGGQLLAGLAGGLAPAGIQAGVQRALTGGDVARFASNVDDFTRLGTTPTVGQAAQSMPMRAVEVGLSRAPGSAMRLAATGQRQADEIGTQVGRVADRLSTRGDSASAGRAIERGIAGRTPGGQTLPNSFMGRTGRTAAELYARVDSALPGDTSVPLTNLRRAVSEISAEIPDAPLTAGATSSPFISRFAQSLEADLAANAQMGMNGMRYSSVKALRSRIGENLDTAALNPDINVQQLRRIYGAFSEDMNAAARAAGPEAERAMTRANNYFLSRMNRLENIERVVQANGGPERVFASAMSGSREGGTTITQVMRSLPEESQRIVASTVLRRLGTAVASQQDDTGQVFNLSTFLTNWNRLHPSARSALFARFDGQIGRDLNSLGRVASNVRDGTMIFPNPAGTAAATLQLAAGSGIVGSVLTGNLPAIGYVMAGLASTNTAARLMTNPSFVRWLAVSQNLSAPAFQASLQTLAATARRENDEDTLEFAERLQAELQNPEQAANGQQREAANR